MVHDIASHVPFARSCAVRSNWHEIHLLLLWVLEKGLIAQMNTKIAGTKLDLSPNEA